MRRFIEDANARPQIWTSVQFTSKLAYWHSIMISRERRPNKRDKVWKNTNSFFNLLVNFSSPSSSWSLTEFPGVFQWTEKMTWLLTYIDRVWFEYKSLNSMNLFISRLWNHWSNNTLTTTSQNHYQKKNIKLSRNKPSRFPRNSTNHQM